MATTVSLEITVNTPSGGEATGQLDVDLSTNPNSGTFTPTGGTETDVTPVTWASSPNGAVGFNFSVGTSANGDFPPGSGPNYTYRFTGNQNGQGDDPSGHVNWPTSSSPTADPEVTWQSGSTAGEPRAAGKGASY